MELYRMNMIAKLIRAHGSADLVLKGETIRTGFAGAGQPGTLVMVDGGYYVVTTEDGRKFNIGKGQLVEVREQSPEGDELDELTFDQLMEIAKGIKLAGRGTARKPQLIAGIRAHRAA